MQNTRSKMKLRRRILFFKMTKDKLYLVIDDRENGVLNEELLNLGVECVVQRLKVGDYVSDKVCIERKTMDDFASSILDKRIETQVENMKGEKDKELFVLISGRISDRTTNIDENCILGKMVSLVVKHGINVICVDNNRQLAYTIKNILEKIEMKGGIIKNGNE